MRKLASLQGRLNGEARKDFFKSHPDVREFIKYQSSSIQRDMWASLDEFLINQYNFNAGVVERTRLEECFLRTQDQVRQWDLDYIPFSAMILEQNDVSGQSWQEIVSEWDFYYDEKDDWRDAGYAYTYILNNRWDWRVR